MNETSGVPTIEPWVDRARELAACGLFADGARRKQWFLERILEALGADLQQVREEFERHGVEYAEGIAP